MNRLQLRSHEQESENKTSDIEQAILTATERRGIRHAIFAPLHYEPNYAYPLIIWLHGPRDSELQLQRIMPEVSMRNYVAISPRAPAADGSGFTWMGASLGLAEQSVFECLDLAREKFNIAPHRVFLAGYDHGGSLAFRLGLRHPELFAGILSVGGPFPLGQMPLARLNQIRDLPLFIAQGNQSERYPVERTCDELRLFHSAGLAVTLRQYPCNHELNSLMLRDMDAWIMEIVTGVRAAMDDADGTPEFGLN